MKLVEQLQKVQRKQAFTLIELLVVIAIIAILALALVRLTWVGVETDMCLVKACMLPILVTGETATLPEATFCLWMVRRIGSSSRRCCS